MARWRLMTGHYIHAVRDGQTTKWIHKEVNRANGREIQKEFLVPLHLDPKDKDDWTHEDVHPYDTPVNNRSDAGVIIASDGKPPTNGKDVIIEVKSVTVDMEPLDDDAKAISANVNAKAVKVDGFGESYSERLLDQQIQRLADAAAKETPGVEKVLESMTTMMEQNQKILSALIEPKDRRIR